MKKNLIRMFAYLKPEWRSVAAGIAALAVCDGLQFVVPQVIRRAVDDLAGGKATFGRLGACAAIILGISLVVGFFRFFWRHFIQGASYRIDRKLREDLYVKMQRLPQGFYHDFSTGDLMARSTNDIRQVQMASGIGVVILADTFLMGVTALVFMLSISPHLTFFSIFPLVSVLVLVLAMDPGIRRRFETVQERFSELTERLRENISGIRVVKAFVQEREEIASYERLSETYVRDNMRLVRLWGALFPAIMLFTGVAAALTLLFGGRMAIAGDLSVGGFVAFTAYLGMLTWPMMAVGWVISMFQRGSVSMGRLAEVLDREETKEEPADPDGGPPPSPGAVEFRDATFAYQGSTDPALRGVSFKVAPGGSLGITGRIGSGKSTIVSLLTRLQEPTAGAVFVDGLDVTRRRLSDLRGRISWVPQESFLFSETIAENLSFARPDAPLDDLERAASTAGVLDAIKSFPEGFATRVGERGVTLSGGEKQRVCIARALVKDAPVLLLDDCLSAVDAETERRIIAELARADREKTMVVVSHRVSAVEWCGEILVLEDGAVAERGTHAELVEAGGIYAGMRRKQQLEMQSEGFGSGESGEEP